LVHLDQPCSFCRRVIPTRGMDPPLPASAIPFLNADFLAIIERHGAAARAWGWTPCHLVASDAGNTIVGLLPLYVKTHSHGDFIYDWSWAAAYRQLGREYYPKLMSCLPHTPVAGPRLLVADGPDAAAIRQALVDGAQDAGQPLVLLRGMSRCPATTNRACCRTKGY
jgi:predicted N-acyltransferase